MPIGPLCCAEPIQSRCAIIRFHKLSDADILAKLIDIAEREHIQYTQVNYSRPIDLNLVEFLLAFSLLANFDSRLLDFLDTGQDGLEAVVFTAQGDMRQAINNVQSTIAGFERITADNVFKA